MEIILKVSAIAVVSAALSILLKKYNPEISLLLSFCVIIFIFTLASTIVGKISELIEMVKMIASPPDTLVEPVVKCLGISIVTKISGDLCRDSSQAASASALEFTGAACAMAVSMPMLISVLKMISSFV